MYEVSCAVCSASFEYNLEDYIHLCPYCSSGFILDLDEGVKDLIGDHYIIPNRLDRERVGQIFHDWIVKRYHRADSVAKEFKTLGCYGVCLPFWIVSVEVHTFWSGQTAKASTNSENSNEYGAKFVREEGRFSRRYRWAILARKSPKEHWGMDRIHHPLEDVMVDLDGFPLDESLGVIENSEATIYDQKQAFKFEHSNGLAVMGVQVKESAAIARARDQMQEYHRRIAKTKVGTLYDHRTEIEVVGIHLVHVPFWFLRYAFVPQSLFRFFTTMRERRLVVQGFTEAVIEAELPLNPSDKVMTNIIVCGSLAFISLSLSVFLHPLFFVLFVLFGLICILSAVRIFGRVQKDTDVLNNKGVAGAM